MFTFNDDGSFSYTSNLVLKLAATGETMHHTDRNTLQKVGEQGHRQIPRPVSYGAGLPPSRCRRPLFGQQGFACDKDESIVQRPKWVEWEARMHGLLASSNHAAAEKELAAYLDDSEVALSDVVRRYQTRP